MSADWMSTLDEYEILLSSLETRLLLDEDPTMWAGYEEWLDEMQALEEEFHGTE